LHLFRLSFEQIIYLKINDKKLLVKIDFLMFDYEKIIPYG